MSATQTCVYDGEARDTREPHEMEGEGNNKDCVLPVVRELDNLLSALRLLVRTCEKQKFHKQTHVLELSVEILLRRRNYILNVSLASSSSNSPYPCYNCYITYPTVFLMSWLDYLLYEEIKEVVYAPPDPSLCRRSCSQYFSAFSRADHLTEGALYPLGAPFVPGPTNCPPGASTTAQSNVRMLGESDELDYTSEAVKFVLNTLRAHNGCNSANVDLAERVFDSLHCRKDFGFDMDCVNSAAVEKCRLELFKCLVSYDSRVLAESLDRAEHQV